MNFDQTDLFAFFGKTFNRFFNNAAAGSHADDDVFSVRASNVIKQIVLAAGNFGELVHRFLNDSRNGVIVLVASFASLEVNVRVLSGSANGRVVGVHTALTMSVDQIERNHRLDLIFGNLFHRVDFVRNAEPVKEVKERNAGFERGAVSDHRHILRFLNACASQHSPAAHTASHNVGMVAKNRKSVSRNGTGGNMENRGGEFASDFEHVRNHQQQALRRGERAGQSAGGKRTVNSACRARFGLHFNDVRNYAKNILFALSRPFVSPFAHRAGRGNRVNCHNFAAQMRYVRRRFVSIGHYEISISH